MTVGIAVSIAGNVLLIFGWMLEVFWKPKEASKYEIVMGMFIGALVLQLIALALSLGGM